MAEMVAGTVIQSDDYAVFFKDSDAYFRLEHTTQLSLNTETETEEKKFIAFRSPTVFNKNTKFSFENDLYTIKGEKDFEYFFKLFKNLVKEQPKDTEVLIVFKCEGDESLGFTAWQFKNAKIQFSSDSFHESTLNFTVNLGDGILGKVTMLEDAPTFAPDEE